jgi:hypothetical protein
MALTRLLGNANVEVATFVAGIRSANTPIDPHLPTTTKTTPSDKASTHSDGLLFDPGLLDRRIDARLVFGLLLHSVRLTCGQGYNPRHQDLNASIAELSRTMSQLSRSLVPTQDEDRRGGGHWGVSHRGAHESNNYLGNSSERYNSGDDRESQWSAYLDRTGAFVASLLVDLDTECLNIDINKQHHVDGRRVLSLRDQGFDNEWDAVAAASEITGRDNGGGDIGAGARARALRVILTMIHSVRHLKDESVDGSWQSTREDRRRVAARAIEGALAKLMHTTAR